MKLHFFSVIFMISLYSKKRNKRYIFFVNSKKKYFRRVRNAFNRKPEMRIFEF